MCNYTSMLNILKILTFINCNVEEVIVIYIIYLYTYYFTKV